MHPKLVLIVGSSSAIIAVILLSMTLFLLCQFGYVWLAMMIFAPLAYGLAYCVVRLVAELRPDWFKPDWLEKHSL